MEKIPEDKGDIVQSALLKGFMFFLQFFKAHLRLLLRLLLRLPDDLLPGGKICVICCTVIRCVRISLFLQSDFMYQDFIGFYNFDKLLMCIRVPGNTGMI